MPSTRVKKGTPAPKVFEPYENCPFCKHKKVPGCFGCAERRRADEREARQCEEDLARMEAARIGTFHFDNPAEMETLRSAFSVDALKRHFDGADIADSDVVKWIGEGSIEVGEETIEKAISFVLQSQTHSFMIGDPRNWTAPRQAEEIREAILKEQRSNMIQERGMRRVVEAVSGKPGAGPGANDLTA